MAQGIVVFSMEQFETSGAVVSIIEIFCELDTVSPQLPVAVQVLVINFVLPQLLTTLSINEISTVPQVFVPVANPVTDGSVSSF